MFRTNKAAAACLLASLLASQGGNARGQFGHHQPPPAAPPCRNSVELPVVSGVDALPDPTRTPIPAIPLPAAGQASPPRTYRGLDADQCASLAASHSEEAAVIDARRVAIMAGLPRLGTDSSRQMLIKGLGYTSDEIRNQDACKALTLFYRLAQAQLEAEILRRSRLEVSEALDTSKEQVDRGLLTARETYDALRLRQVDLIAKQVELAGTIERLNIALRNLLSTSPRVGDWMVRPLVDWRDVAAAPDAGQAVALGLAQSPQLLMLRTVVAEVDQNSQSAVEQLLATVSPLVGSTGPVGPALGLSTILQTLRNPRARKESTETLRMRARQILAWRERTLETEIREAVLNIETGLQEIAVARDQYALRAEELERLRKKSDRGLTPSLELATARLELLKSQGRWVDLAAELNVRRVDLDRLLGRYARCR